MGALGQPVQALERATSVSLATVSPDGRPHVVPLWFHWDGDAITVFSKPHARKLRNLLTDGRAMVAVGEPGVDAVLFEATAVTAPASGAEAARPFARKYAEGLRRLELEMDEFLETYPTLIRLSPSRRLAWGGPGRVQMPGDR